MTFIQSDIDPLFLRERHLQLNKSKSNSSLSSTDSIMETEGRSNYTTLQQSNNTSITSLKQQGLKRPFFDTTFISSSSSSSSNQSQQASLSNQSSTISNLDRLVSFYL